MKRFVIKQKQLVNFCKIIFIFRTVQQSQMVIFVVNRTKNPTTKRNHQKHYLTLNQVVHYPLKQIHMNMIHSSTNIQLQDLLLHHILIHQKIILCR